MPALATTMSGMPKASRHASTAAATSAALFAATAQTGLGKDDGPYADFSAAVGAATEDAYAKGPLAKLGGDPDSVAKAVEKAITAAHPPIRVRVTPSAHLLIGVNGLMTDAMWDRFLAAQFPRPGAPV